ncbi:MAG: hypothetical protein QM820_63515 [Minicystis sp.]
MFLVERGRAPSPVAGPDVNSRAMIPRARLDDRRTLAEIVAAVWELFSALLFISAVLPEAARAVWRDRRMSISPAQRLLVRTGACDRPHHEHHRDGTFEAPDATKQAPRGDEHPTRTAVLGAVHALDPQRYENL